MSLLVVGFAAGVFSTVAIAWLFFKWGIRELVRKDRLKGSLDGKEFRA